jgi:DUF971 family protein
MTAPSELRTDGATRELTLAWPGGDTRRLTHARLRRACPCAACRAIRIAGGAVEVSERVTLIDIQPMGYGVQLAFSDGHARGIYPWGYLEGLCDGLAPVFGNGPS